jgi:hypothetical protein
VGGELRQRLAMISSLAELDDLLGKLDPTAPFPESELGRPRGRTNSPGKVALPEHWIEDVDSDLVPVGGRDGALRGVGSHVCAGTSGCSATSNRRRPKTRSRLPRSSTCAR